MASAIYDEVQVYLTECKKAGVAPTLEDIGKYVFKDDYNPDSRYQRDAIYGAIDYGRFTALNSWKEYCESPDFNKDIEEIEYYHPEKVLEEFKDVEFGGFNTKLYRGAFNSYTDTLKKNENTYAHIAVLWRKKQSDFSTQKNQNLVIASYGKKSTWHIPSFWGWAVREVDLFKRSLHIIEKQLHRGEDAQIALPTGKPYSKAIGYINSTRALIEDGTSWVCKCEMVNSAEANFCSNCGSSKGELN